MAYNSGKYKGKNARELEMDAIKRIKENLPPDVVKKIFKDKKAMGGYMKRNDGGIAKNTRIF
tara:strand:- start:138 stop:323 length:186 start_codon:yes stop_codon:yes gene_type:complete